MAKVHLADDFCPSFGIQWRPVLTRAQVEGWDNERLAHYLKVRKEVEAGAINNPVGQGWSLPMWDLVQENWTKYKNIVVCGGNRCLRGDSVIYDPILGISRRIDSIDGPHNVYAWDGQNLVVAEAERPFAKPAGPMHRVRLSNGQEFVGASEHRILLSSGSWMQLSHLLPGYSLFLPQTTLDTFRQGHMQDAPHSTQKEQDSQGDYPFSPHLGDELLLEVLETYRELFPLSGDAPKHIFASDNMRHRLAVIAFDLQQRRLGVLGRIFSHIPIWKRFYRLATLDDLLRRVGQFADSECRASGIPYKSPLRSRVGLAPGQAYRQPIAGSDHHLQCSDEFHLHSNLSCHGVAYVKSVESAGIEVKWDMTVPAYGNYWQSGVIHHNSSKSTLASRLTLWGAATIPEADVRCYHVNEDRSIQDQQSMIYDALPAGIKSLPTKKGMHHSLSYSQKNGFTDNICILPPLPGYRKGSQIVFGNYRQYQQDAQVAEGFKSHIIWLEEESPQKLFETLQYRTVDYHGRLILTFTTITGWTPLIQDILGKTRTIKSRFAPLIGRELPIMQESISRPGTVIYYFWTEDNAFIDTRDFIDKIKGRPKDEILARAYGIPTKAVAGVFPGFNKDVNVIPHEKLPWLEANLKKDKKGNPIPYKVTRYMAIDPAGSKAWFMAWVAIDALGTWWVYREHPDNDDWALPGNTVEGKPGPAQKGQKLGIKGYVELANGLEKEDGAEIFERYIDPRMGAAERQSEDGATTIISDLEDAGMSVIPAPGVDIENGIQLINNLLAWDENKPRDSLNSPKLYISDRCQNIIYALSEYTAKGGASENCKDPIDCLRYLAVSDIQFIDSKQYSDAVIHGRTGSY